MLLPELQIYKDTVKCGELGANIPGQHQEKLMQTLIVRLLKTHFFAPIFDVKSQQNIIELVTRPDKNLVSDAYYLSLGPHLLLNEIYYGPSFG